VPGPLALQQLLEATGPVVSVAPAAMQLLDRVQRVFFLDEAHDLNQ
jgi:hypothetical protein